MSGNVIKRCPATQRRQATQQRPTVALQRHHADLLNGIQSLDSSVGSSKELTNMMSASNGRETATKSATSKTNNRPSSARIDGSFETIQKPAGSDALPIDGHYYS